MTASPSTRGSWLTRERMVLAGLLAFTVVVRGGLLWAMREKLVDDPDAYRRIAENLLADGTFSMDEPEESQEPSSSVRTPNPQKAPWKTPTAYRPPLYPVVLSNLAAGDQSHVSLGKVAGLHLLLGVGTVWLTWSLARRLQIASRWVGESSETSADPRGAGAALRGSAPAAGLTHPTSMWMTLVAGVIVACDPILLNQSALVMTETLAAFLAVLSLWCLARFDLQRSWFNAGLAGGAMGLAVLCRPTFLPWVGLVAVGILCVRGLNSERRMQNSEFRKGRWSWVGDVGWRVANCAALVGVAAAVVSPWVIRNQRVFGKPIVTTTHGGYTLWLGNNWDFYEWLRHDESGLPWQNGVTITQDVSQRLRRARLSIQEGMPQEIAYDEMHKTMASSAISADVGSFIRACLYRLGQLWSPLPNRLTVEESTGRRLLRYAVAAWYCGVYLLAAVGIWRLRWKLLQPPWVWGLLLCLVFTGVHTFYWSNLRMRAPLMPFVALVAGAAFLGRNRPPMDADERG